MEIIDDQSEDAGREGELDGNRIHQLTALRRGAIRARSWCLITAIICLIGAIELLFNSIQLSRSQHYWGLWSTSYVLFAIAAIIVSSFFLRRARALKREIDKPSLEQPKNTPDFSELSDGSQRWKNLEEL